MPVPIRRRQEGVGSWRPGDAQLGWIIENRLDEAFLLSWPGQLETYVPLHDTGGYDRARAPLGSYDWRLDQVKGSTSVHPGNLVKIAFTVPRTAPAQTPGLHLRPLRSGYPRAA